MRPCSLFSMCILVMALAPLGGFAQANAQSVEQDSLVQEKAAVERVVRTLFQAMKNADTLALGNCFAPSPILQTVGRDRQSQTLVRTDGLAAFLASVAQLSPGRADERIKFGAVLLDGDLASVWTPYRFYLDGKFSHCGANSFQLVKLAGTWKIQYLIDTRRRNGCVE